MKTVFKVSIPHTNRDFFDYYADTVEPSIGARVWVPFRKQSRMGIVIAHYEPETPHASTKSIITVIDDKPLVSGEVLALCFWVSSYYQSPLSEVIPLALPKKYRNGDDSQLPTCDYYTLAVGVEQARQLLTSRTPRQQLLVDFFAKSKTPLAKKMVLQAGFNSSLLDALLTKGILAVQTKRVLPTPSGAQQKEPLALNSEQSVAVQAISAHLHSYRCFLLQGVTGSGKTEVYLQVIARVLAAGKQVLARKG